MELHLLKQLFKTYKESQLFGRYITHDVLLPLIKKHQKQFDIHNIGESVLGESIHAITIGSGPKKILMWSQMHGNESTTTKALFDLLNVFSDASATEIQNILKSCTIAMIPMLNPDGARLYTRVNANQVDLNRDAQDRSQPESVALRAFFEKFKPDLCFNLHGQRTIFSAGTADFPATLSFLAPAQDQACTITENRKKAMELIVHINKVLQLQIPNQVGRYDDAFNLNCVGDTFQSLNIPTVLFEAGHFENDYNREVVREFVFQSLMVSIHYSSTTALSGFGYEDYDSIPQNQKLYFDLIIRNAQIKDQIFDIGVQYQERLANGKIDFIPIVEKISDLKGFYGHKEVDANSSAVFSTNQEPIFEGYENDFVLLNNELFSLKL